jgi:hypothetical protein
MNNVSKIETPRIAKGAQPSFFDAPAIEAMYGMLVVMLEEICVLRDRVDTCERLGEQGIVVTPTSIEAYEADDEVEAFREERRRQTINRVMRPVKTLQQASVQRAQSRYEREARKIAEQEI